MLTSGPTINSVISAMRRLLVYVKWLFVPTAIAFLGYYGWASRDLLSTVIVNAMPGYLIISVALWVMMHFFVPLFSVIVLGACNDAVSYRNALQIHLSNLPAKYIPGGIWHTVGRLIQFRERDISPRSLAVFVFLENVLAAAVAFLLGGFLVYLFRGLGGWGGVAVFSAVAGLAAIMLAPVILNLYVLKQKYRFPVRDYAASAGMVSLFWCAGACAFVAYMSSFPGVIQDSHVLEVGGVYLFAWGIGFISVFAPQGVGIFEVVSGDLLKGPINLGGLAALLAGFRLIIFIADLLAWGVGRLFLGKRTA